MNLLEDQARFDEGQRKFVHRYQKLISCVALAISILLLLFGAYPSCRQFTA